MGVRSTQFSVVMVGVFPEDPNFICGGVQASVYGLAKSLPAIVGVRHITVISPPIDARASLEKRTIDGIDVWFLDAPYRFISSAVLRVGLVFAAIGNVENPIVHMHGTGIIQTVLCVTCRLKKVPLIWTLHGITEKETHEAYLRHRTVPNFLRYVLYRLLERTCLSLVADIIVDTPYVRDAIDRSRGVEVIPQGIFAEELKPFRARPKNRNLVVSIGAMGPRKGHHLTLDAFARVKQTVPNAQLVIAGAEYDKRYYEQLVGRVAELGLSESVTIRLNLKRADLLELYGMAQVFALHSQEESQGIVFCEAMTAGVPIVATNVGGVPNIVQNGASGLLVAYGDVERFAECIARLLTDDVLHAQIVTEGKMRSERYDWPNIASEVAKIYRRALKLGQAARAR